MDSPWTNLPLSLAEIARRCKVSDSLLRKVKSGKRPATEDLAVRIHYVTGGALPCWVLRPDRWREGQVPPAPALSKTPAA